MALTAGSYSASSSLQVTAATIAPQGTAVTNTLASPTAEAAAAATQTLDFGTGSGQADILCAGQFTLAAAGTLTLDVYTGTDLKNVFGGTAAIRHLKGIAVSIVSGGDAAGLTIGGAGANPNILFFGNTNDTWTIFPDGPAFLGGSPAGVVVDATHLNVKLLNNGGVSITFDVFLAGTST